MQNLSIVGFPRIGEQRELKRVVEDFFNHSITRGELLEKAAGLRRKHWLIQAEKGIDFIPSNDFSFYDTFLDTAYMLNVIQDTYRDLGLDAIETYFAMAKGYQQGAHDVKALAMRKWFNTNYHYMVPVIDRETDFRLNGSKPFEEYSEALALGIRTKPVITGPLTFLKLSKINAGNKTYLGFGDEIIRVYKAVLNKFNELQADFIQIDEPALVTDLTPEEVAFFLSMYQELLKEKKGLKVLLQTYFGDIRDVYPQVASLEFDALGLDFIEGAENLRLIEKFGYPPDKMLFAGVVNGKNIWRNNYRQTLTTLNNLAVHLDKENIVLNTSCSLLHVPYTVKNETAMEDKYKKHLAFAVEKLEELQELGELFQDAFYVDNKKITGNQMLFKEKNENREFIYQDVRNRIANLQEEDFVREPAFEDRIALQKEVLDLPLFPTTTIGSFPQTAEVRQLRKSFKNAGISFEEYHGEIKSKIADLIRLQEDMGLDVLVHGEFERNDMVEYFGENLSGFIFTGNGWVQSYGTRCVKPPVIFGDVKRLKPITIDYITFAQGLTEKPVKGMLTGPVTILNWSFPREDLSLQETAFQIALAIKAEVMALEEKGIKIIQIDEAALREKLPLRRQDWHSQYLDWAIKAFKLVHSGVRPRTQIHTHMCYSEFKDIIKEIEAMDVDVISFEAARSNLSIIAVLKENNFQRSAGPGVYDIHSPRIPGKKEIYDAIMNMTEHLDTEKIWINPDCGLKTRKMEEAVPSLKNMVAAAKAAREWYYSQGN